MTKTFQSIVDSAFPAEDEAHAAALDPKLYRVLRRLPALQKANGGECVGLIVDCETSSTDPATMEPIEVCLLQFAYNRDGTIGGAFDPIVYRQEPKRPITPEATAIHGIRNEDVAGQRFDLVMMDRIARAAMVSSRITRPTLARRSSAGVTRSDRQHERLLQRERCKRRSVVEKPYRQRIDRTRRCGREEHS